MKTRDIRIRDPFILTDREEGCYYMYGTNGAETFSPGGGFQVKNSFWAYRSRDLESWEDPVPVFTRRMASGRTGLLGPGGPPVPGTVLSLCQL